MHHVLRDLFHTLAITWIVTGPTAQTIPRPTGIFCSCPPTTARSSSFLATVAQRGFVDGFLVRVGWGTLEPSPGVYDWSLLDGQLTQIRQAGLRAALAVVQGPSTPAWLGSIGVATYTFSFRGASQTIALPWDPVYLQRWTSFVSALGARYFADPTIALVHATHATQNGFEMQLPFAEEGGYRAAGYSDAVFATSWEAVLDAFLVAFPLHAVDVDLHPIWGSDAVAQRVVAYGLAQGGDRFGAFGGWWNVHNATVVYPGMQELFESTAAASFANVQNVGSWVTTPDRYGFDLATYLESHELALRSGIRYVEVWNADLLDASLDAAHAELATALRCSGWFQAYPDAAALPTWSHRIAGCPSPGSSFELRAAGGPAFGVAALLLGTQRSSIAIPGVGDQLVGPIAQVAAVPVSLDALGEMRLGVNVPTGSALHAVVTQVAVASGGHIVLSNGVELRLP